jgi:hypothetical protein
MDNQLMMLHLINKTHKHMLAAMAHNLNNKINKEINN